MQGTGVISVWKGHLSDEENWRRTGELLDILLANGCAATPGRSPRGPCWVVTGTSEGEMAHLARSLGEETFLFGLPGDLRLFRS